MPTKRKVERRRRPNRKTVNKRAMRTRRRKGLQKKRRMKTKTKKRRGGWGLNLKQKAQKLADGVKKIKKKVTDTSVENKAKNYIKKNSSTLKRKYDEIYEGITIEEDKNIFDMSDFMFDTVQEALIKYLEMEKVDIYTFSNDESEEVDFALIYDKTKNEYVKNEYVKNEIENNKTITDEKVKNYLESNKTVKIGKRYIFDTKEKAIKYYKSLVCLAKLANNDESLKKEYDEYIKCIKIHEFKIKNENKNKTYYCILHNCIGNETNNEYLEKRGYDSDSISHFLYFATSIYLIKEDIIKQIRQDEEVKKMNELKFRIHFLEKEIIGQIKYKELIEKLNEPTKSGGKRRTKKRPEKKSKRKTY